ICLKPRSIAATCRAERTPDAARPRACARLPAMSYGYSSKSTASEDEKRSSSGSRARLKRPPHSLPAFLLGVLLAMVRAISGLPAACPARAHGAEIGRAHV